MSAFGATGFFGKLPGSGDFVQRRLPAGFVDRWDASFEKAVSEARAALGPHWQEAYRSSPVWRFVMAPRVCGDSAWAGVMGPGADRVGRCFPMVIAAELAPDATACSAALARSDWFTNAADLLADAQRDPRGGIDAFDSRVAALSSLAAIPAAADPQDPTDRADWATAAHWRLPMPTPAAFSSRYLSTLWSRLGAGSWCLWWTEGGARVPASVLVTAGLPQAQAYAGFLDASHGSAWKTIGSLPSPAPVRTGLANEPRPCPPAMPERPAAPLDNDVTQPFRRAESPAAAIPPGRLPAPGDLSDLLPTVAPFEPDQATPPLPQTPPPEASPSAGRSPFAASLRREDCALTVVAASDFGQDQRIASAALAAARELRTAELSTGLQGLRNRLLALHERLRALAATDPTGAAIPSECSLAAAHVTGGQGALLRFGAASVWRWRRGQLQALFVPRSAAVSPDDDGGDLDDLLFSTPVAADAGIGANSLPAWDETTCGVQVGDRLLLAATRRLVLLSPDVLARALMMPTRVEVSRRLAAACGLPPDPRSWPFSVIEVGA